MPCDGQLARFLRKTVFVHIPVAFLSTPDIIYQYEFLPVPAQQAEAGPLDKRDLYLGINRDDAEAVSAYIYPIGCTSIWGSLRRLPVDQTFALIPASGDFLPRALRAAVAPSLLAGRPSLFFHPVASRTGPGFSEVRAFRCIQSTFRSGNRRVRIAHPTV
jgi:hypothetical protein